MEFDERSWSRIEDFLPDNAFVRKIVLEDLMWFVNRPKKYKSNKEKIEDYIRHLHLKAKPVFDVKPNETKCFASLDIEKLKDVLLIALHSI